MRRGRQAAVGAAAFLVAPPSQLLSQFSKKGPFCAMYLFEGVGHNPPSSPSVGGKQVVLLAVGLSRVQITKEELGWA